jgi:hypothetical protein
VLEEIEAVAAGLEFQKSKKMMMLKLVKFENHQTVRFSANHYLMKTRVALGLRCACEDWK